MRIFSATFAFDKLATNGQTDIKHEMWKTLNCSMSFLKIVDEKFFPNKDRVLKREREGSLLICFRERKQSPLFSIFFKSEIHFQSWEKLKRHEINEGIYFEPK